MTKNMGRKYHSKGKKSSTVYSYKQGFSWGAIIKLLKKNINLNSRKWNLVLGSEGKNALIVRFMNVYLQILLSNSKIV